MYLLGKYRILSTTAVIGLLILLNQQILASEGVTDPLLAHLIRVSDIPLGKNIHFNYKPEAKDKALSITINQTTGDRYSPTILENLTTSFSSDSFVVVVAVGPNKLPDFLTGKSTNGCTINLTVGSEDGGRWSIRTVGSFVASKNQDFKIDAPKDGSKLIKIKIDDRDFTLVICEVEKK